jgi:hypothetical protein
MAANERVDIVPGNYLDAERNGYYVEGMAENPNSGERVIVYRPISDNGQTIGTLHYLPMGTFQSLVTPGKGYKRFAKMPRTLARGFKPGSLVDKQS